MLAPCWQQAPLTATPLHSLTYTFYFTHDADRVRILTLAKAKHDITFLHPEYANRIGDSPFFYRPSCLTDIHF